MKNSHLLASDFDGTIALTSVPSPRGVTVDLSYEMALREIFGENGVKVYEEVGRVQSKEPGELMAYILSTGDVLNIPLPTEGKSLPELTDELIQHKLGHILPEISPEWPLVAPGFEEFVEGVGSLPIELAVISNGHDEFIRRFFDVHELPQPGILVTSDTLRSNGVPQKFKPDPYSVELAIDHFTHLNGGRPVSILYVGDSEEKDGEMARNAGVPFGLINPEAEFSSSVNHGAHEIAFKDFAVLQRLLFRDPTIFHGNRGFDGIFLNGKATEGHSRGKER